jgi:hypothetical protein
MQGLTRLLADAQFNGDVYHAQPRMDKYITDLAFVMKNPVLGYHPGEGVSGTRRAKFSDEITGVDRARAEQEAIAVLPGFLTGEHDNDPLSNRMNGLTSRYRELSGMVQSNAVMSPAERDAYGDLNSWSQGYVSAYRRATMGETGLGQFVSAMVEPDNMNGLIGAFGGFAGISESGQRISRSQAPVMFASRADSASEGGVYEFPDAQNPGKQYVGQSGNLAQRIQAQRSAGRIEPGVEPIITEVPGGKTAREVAEQTRINELGGTRNVAGSQASNIRNPIGPNRRAQVEQQFGPIPPPPKR